MRRVLALTLLVAMLSLVAVQAASTAGPANFRNAAAGTAVGARADRGGSVLQFLTRAHVLPPTSRAYGASLAEWAKRYFLFDAAIPVVDGSHPGIDVGDVDCSIGQRGHVWFLETVSELVGEFERRCSVPFGTVLYIPVIQLVCSPEIFGEEAAACLAPANDAYEAVDLTLIVDGVTLEDSELERYRASTGVFDLPLVEDSYWEYFFGELPDSVEFASDAVGVLTTPLLFGRHEIVIKFASEAFGIDGTLTYTISVAPPWKR